MSLQPQKLTKVFDTPFRVLFCNKNNNNILWKAVAGFWNPDQNYLQVGLIKGSYWSTSIAMMLGFSKTTIFVIINISNLLFITN